MSDDRVPLKEWISYIFDHPATDPEWHSSNDVPELDPGPERTTSLIAETFERAGNLLGRFSDAQLNQAFWFLLSAEGSGCMFALAEPGVPWPMRRRALQSFVPLFEQVMAVRCSPHLSHLDEQQANPLNSCCYMWWDIIPLHGKPKDASRAELDAEVLRLLQRLLAIPHDACRESGLHGLGHWQHYYPHAAEIIEDFLHHSQGLRPELVAYAEQAKIGYIQ